MDGSIFGTLRRLYRYVAMLAEELNFTHAAAKLHVAQPALSRQIRQIEDYLGTDLFERDNRGVRLTLAGEAFAAEARLTYLTHSAPWMEHELPMASIRVHGESDIRHSSIFGYLPKYYSTCQLHIRRAICRRTLWCEASYRLVSVIIPVREGGLVCEVSTDKCYFWLYRNIIHWWKKLPSKSLI